MAENVTKVCIVNMCKSGLSVYNTASPRKGIASYASVCILNLLRVTTVKTFLRVSPLYAVPWHLCLLNKEMLLKKRTVAQGIKIYQPNLNPKSSIFICLLQNALTCYIF
jgi:hypothetical protein